MDGLKLLLAGGALLLGAAIYGIVSEEEKNARRRWEKKRDEVTNTLKYHHRKISEHIRQRNENYRFHQLVNLHYSSVLKANAAYKLLQDARTSIGSINKMLKAAKEQKIKLQKMIDDAKIKNDRESVSKLIHELRLLNEFRNKLFDERDDLYAQKDHLYNEVKKLNAETRKLKEHIRDNCGERGMLWYEKLEERKMRNRIGFVCC
jgi:FtsZ-binding cell division protein ZapB